MTDTITATPRPLTVGALFAGYGGLELALAAVFPIDLVWYAEFDPNPARIMAHHHHGVPNLWDVTKVDWSTVPRVDVITGGSPCQDLSHAGKRRGMTTGTRSNLWVEMREAIATIRPRFVLWENVRGALSAEADSDLEPCPGCVGGPGGDGKPVLRALGRVVGDLSDLGYVGRWFGLRAADVGAAHGRFRVFLVAEDARHADGSGLEGRHQGGRPDERSAGPAGVGYPGGLSLLPTPVADNSRGLPSGGTDYQSLPNAVALLPTATAGDAAASSMGNDKSGQGSLTDVAQRELRTQWGDYDAAIERAERTFAHRPAPEPTEPTAKGGRRLSPRFVEWHMGLPDGWVTDPAIWEGMTNARGKTLTGRALEAAARNAQLKALGNGVVYQQAEAAVRAYFRDTGRPVPVHQVPAPPRILLPTPNPFHMGNDEEPEAWRARRLDVFQRTGTRHGPALSVVAKSITDGHPLTPDQYMPDDADPAAADDDTEE